MRTDYDYVNMRKFEEVVDTYLSANFLAQSVHDFVFVTDKNLQYRGADISCDSGLIIDSKIKNTNSLNEIYQYPSVEITIKHNAQLGWFVSPDSMTNAYFFISVFADAKRYEDVTPENITKLNVLIFSKRSLTEFIERYVPIKTIIDDALELDEFYDRKDYYDANGKKVFHLKYSPYKEGAVNLVFNRELLLSLKGSKEITK